MFKTSANRKAFFAKLKNGLLKKRPKLFKGGKNWSDPEKQNVLKEYREGFIPKGEALRQIRALNALKREGFGKKGGKKKEEWNTIYSRGGNPIGMRSSLGREEYWRSPSDE